MLTDSSYQRGYLAGACFNIIFVYNKINWTNPKKGG